MQAIQYVKRSSYLLLVVIPISLMGYFFAVNHENLFFLYEWALMLIIFGAGVFALIGALKTKGKEKWILFSILMFCVQFAVLGLFLGPFSVYPMFYVYYGAAAISFGIIIYTIFRVDLYRFIPVSLLIVSVLITFYMNFLQMLWGKDLS
ncbi:hypothetical protein QUF49_15640 [Fictibacillus sp. b24]|uniref:hypothetical protein n=1 Tax=Fictibacillus sp. b24 TaxID=3055863 RepID=UPI0025A0F64C|nr:hypothetical protein [Fictibacillus sp. b24]MDM5317443.1 hypothetical protein [Fictibacillus sp. b24]